MNDKTITIEGKDVPVDQVAMVFDRNTQAIDMHSLICSGLADASDQLYRAHMASAFFSANTAVALGRKLVEILEIGDPVAVKVCIDLSGRMNREHKNFWDKFQTAYEEPSRAEAMPADLEERRGLIRASLDSALAALTAVQADVAALPLDHAARASAEIVLILLAKAATEATSSVEFALGVPTMEVTDNEVNDLIAQSMAQLTIVMGKTEEEARAMIAMKLGTTMAEHKAAIIAQSLAPLAPTSEGSLNGSLLSAEKEVMILDLGVEKVKELIAAK